MNYKNKSALLETWQAILHNPAPVMMTANDNSFGSTLRALRNERRLSADAVARLLHDRGLEYTAQAITAWERGEYEPKRQDVVDALDDVLGGSGQLLILLGAGMSRGPTLESRVSDLEADVRDLRDLINQLVERLGPRSRRAPR